MLKFSFFKNKQPKGFQFKPRYYNAEKEALEARIRAAQLEADSENNSSSATFDSEVMRLRMRKQWGTSSEQANRQSNIRIMWIAALLALAFYVFLYTDFDKFF
jgi:hypothetical protein